MKITYIDGKMSFLRKKEIKDLKKKIKDVENETKEKIERLEKMDIVDNLKSCKDLYKQKKKKEVDEESTIDEFIAKIMKIKKKISEDPFIQYELEF